VRAIKLATASANNTNSQPVRRLARAWASKKFMCAASLDRDD
jgi:hypothetical protein